jgi:hypothetical protein
MAERQSKGPLFNSGSVNLNAELDIEEIDDRISNSNEGKAYYGHGNDKDAHHANPGDLVFSRRKPKKTHDIPVFATLNGYGRIGQSPMDMQNDIFLVGVAGVQGATHMWNDQTHPYSSSSPNFAIILGGTPSIINRGTKYINAGDWLRWKLPPGQFVSKGANTRIYPLVEPYKAKLDTVSATALINIIMGTDEKSGKYDTPVVEGSKRLSAALLHVMLLGVNFALENGLVQLPGAATYEGQTKTDFLVELSKDIGCIPSTTPPKLEKTAKAALFTCPIPSVGATHQVPPKDAGALFRFHHSYLNKIYSAIRKIDLMQTSCIFGMALESKGPGERLTVKFGSYTK